MLSLQPTGEEHHHADPGAHPTQGDTNEVRGSKSHSALNQNSAGTRADRPVLPTKSSSVEMTSVALCGNEVSFPAPAGKCEETRGVDGLEFQLHGARLDMDATSNFTLILQSPSEAFLNKRLKCKSRFLPARKEFSIFL